MGRHSRRGAGLGPGRLAAALAAAVVLQLVAGVAVVRRHDSATPAVPREVLGTARTDAAAATARRAVLEERANAVRELLADRARGVLTRDKELFLRGIDAAATEFRDRQARVFDAMAQVPISTWVYDLDPDRETPYDPAVLGHYGTETWVPEIVLRYQLRGFDPHPAISAQFLTFVRRGSDWRLADDADFPGVPNLQTDRELWDFGPVEVVQGARSLVMGRPGRRAMLREIAAQADAAVPRVTAVWGPDWPQRVVVLVPETEAELGTLIAEGNDLSQIAAVAVAQLGGDDARTVGNRIIVNPPNFARLSAVGRRVVLQHEITHVATRDATGRATPTWLVEGFADYVGYLGSGVSVRSASRELRAEVRAGRLPTALPADEDFGGTNPRLAQAYEMAWLACLLVADRTGESSLVRLYRAVGASTEAQDVALRSAFRDVLSSTPESFTRAWRDYLRDRLG